MCIYIYIYNLINIYVYLIFTARGRALDSVYSCKRFFLLSSRFDVFLKKSKDFDKNVQDC